MRFVRWVLLVALLCLAGVAVAQINANNPGPVGYGPIGGGPIGGVSGAATAPNNLSLPVVTPTSPVVGTVETTTNGAWTGSPTGYTYQWEYFDNSTNIGGATSSTYTPIAGDVGHTLAAKVTATNSHGSNTAVSLPTGVVAATASCASSIMSTNCNSFLVTVLQ